MLFFCSNVEKMGPAENRALLPCFLETRVTPLPYFVPGYRRYLRVSVLVFWDTMLREIQRYIILREVQRYIMLREIQRYIMFREIQG
jgi:hypothetical protein